MNLDSGSENFYSFRLYVLLCQAHLGAIIMVDGMLHPYLH